MKKRQMISGVLMLMLLAACSTQPSQQVIRPDGKKVFRRAEDRRAASASVFSRSSSTGYSSSTSSERKTPFVKRQKVGKPYKIMGEWYYPKAGAGYDEIGIASWYGPNFHGKPTATGEIFDQYDLTAAHTTLPLPSIVKVTNLVNGRELIIRVNDRGPFHGGRIIDLSKASAQRLGVTGLAKVRVEYLPEVTQKHLATNGRYIPSLVEKKQAQYATVSSPLKTVKPARLVRESSDLKSAQNIPVQIANNRGPIVSTVPLISVASRNLEPIGVGTAAMSDSRKRFTLATPQVEANEAIKNEPYESHFNFRSTVDRPVLQKMEGAVGNQENIYITKSNRHVQVASFSNRENAEVMMKKVAKLGVAELREVLIGERSWYRVLMKPLQMQTTHDLLSQLHHIGLRDAYILN